MVRRVLGVIVVALVAATAVALLAGTAATADAAAEKQAPLTTPEGFANAEFEIRVYGNGSAEWAVRASRPLDNQTEIDRFRTFESEFESSETEAFRNFRLRAQRLVSFGTNATGREMNATGFARDARVAELGQTRGVVELSFLWTNFARIDGERVVVDDVFQGGMYIDTGQRLVISRGPGLVIADVAPEPDSQAVEGNLTASETITWLGERDFPDQRPKAVLLPPGEDDSDGSAPQTAATTDRVTETPESGAGGIGMLPFVVAVVVLLGLGGGFALYSGAVGDIRRSPGTTVESGSTGSQSGTGTESPAESAMPVPEEELLSDEDRVLELLEDNDGRMKQVDIVESTDWSKSKVSMLLSDMEEEGTISKLRVGRENIISLAGEEPDAAGSPFEDE